LIADNSAIGKFMPMYVGFLGLFSLSSLAFPGTNSFVGELLVLIGAFSQWKLLAAFAIPGALLAAAYMLRLLQKIVWDRVSGHEHGHGHEEGHGATGAHGAHERHLFDLNPREFATLAVLTVFVFWIGLNPRPFLTVMDASVQNVIAQSAVASEEQLPSGGLPGLMNALGISLGHHGGHEAAPGAAHGEEHGTVPDEETQPEAAPGAETPPPQGMEHGAEPAPPTH
jgi:NADH-quinone oxidoreductase subunit M